MAVKRTARRTGVARVKLTVAEGLALINALETGIGTVPLTAALVTALGPVRATTLIVERKGVRLTKEEVVELVKAVYPLIPAATTKDKLIWVVRAAKPAFDTQERYLEVIRYVKERIKLFAAGLEYDDGGSTPEQPYDPSTVLPWDKCTRASCWNGSNAVQRMMNMLSTGMSDTTFDAYLGGMTGLGCNHAHVFLANLADGPHSAPGCSIYGTGRQWSWKKDPAVIAHFNRRIDKILKVMAYVPWLMADDSSLYDKAMAANPEKYVDDLNTAGLFKKASFVCLGLEQDEYMSEATVARLAAAMRKAYKGKLATHHKSGSTKFAKYGDLVMYQVNPGKSPAQISSEVKKAIAATGKPVCMFEMERQPASDAQIKAAFDAGAFSVANWNGTAAALFPGQPSQPATGATHLGDDVDLSKAEWVGKINAANAKVTDDIAPFRHDSKTFYYKQTPGTAAWKPRFTDNGKDLNSAACLAVWRDGRWRVGRFDDCSETRNTRSKINITNGYLKGIRPVVGEPFRFLLVNADGKYRTKAPGGLWTQ